MDVEWASVDKWGQWFQLRQIESEDLYKLFTKYGKLRNDQEGVCLKKNREWYAFIEFEESDAGSEAIKKYSLNERLRGGLPFWVFSLDGYKLDDLAIKVEEANGYKRERGYHEPKLV